MGNESGPDRQTVPPGRAPSPRSRARLLFAWMFGNRRTGGFTIVQFPNIALGLFITTVVLRRILSTGPARTTVEWTGVTALGWWALDEVVRGVNPWRRLLGLGGCAAATAGVVSMWH